MASFFTPATPVVSGLAAGRRLAYCPIFSCLMGMESRRL